MQTKYDEELKKIDIYAKHPGFLPYIGDKYDEYRILHVGESHYIEQNVDDEKYGIEYFQDWWTGGCSEIDQCFEGYFTRPVVEKYINSDGKGKFSIFNNFLKSFSRVVLNKEITITKKNENRKLYEYMAFMNFFQMPAIYNKNGFQKSLWISAKKAGDTKLAENTWKEACQNAVETLDAVIDVINPEAVVITSIDAGEIYKQNGRHQDLIIITSHPASPFSWNKPLKRLGGKTGKDVFEEGLKVIYKK
ncbi:MAG: hypothetical protein J6E46_12535 [Faecalicoccus sp.]|nr:hypothetical protein [Faecalicoccus sp.]